MNQAPPKKYQCGWCKKKFISEIRPPFVLDGKYGKQGKKTKGVRLGDPVVLPDGYVVNAPGPSRFHGTGFACSVECYRSLTGQEPPDDATQSQGTSPDQP